MGTGSEEPQRVASGSSYIAHTAEDYRGKLREEPLVDHLNEVSQMAGEFADAFGARELGEQIGLAHDIGKYSDAFQNHIKNGDNYKVDHSTAGAYELLQKGCWCGAYCVAGHHAGLPDGGTDASLNDGTLSARMKKACGGEIEDYSACVSETNLQQADQGWFSWLDFLGGGTQKEINERAAYSNSFAVRMLFSCLVDADFLCTERFMQGKEREGLHYDSLSTLRNRFEAHIAAFYPPQGHVNELRCEVLDACLDKAAQKPGVFSLTVPTGGGKTLGSMRFALSHALYGGNDLRRVIYAVPYTSIIEQNAGVFREILGKENVLEHHANFDFDFDSEGGGSEDGLGERLRLAAENWDAPVVVTTNVQFFESLYSAKTSRCRKLHNIARSVIVLDEAQMIPTAQIRPCIRALAELVVNYGCSVVLCTATQPAFDDFFDELGLGVREIVPDPERLSVELERVSYECLGTLSDEELALRVAEEPRALCIVDNRAQAKRIFEMLVEHGVEGVCHLSTLMHPAHRQITLKTIRKRMEEPDVPCRVVSTSLVEAGVDLDFPVVFRSVAGVDSIDQAAGRCNREGKLGRAGGRVYVFEPESGVNLPSDVANRASVTREALRASLDDDFSRIGSLEAIEAYFTTLYRFRDDLDKKRALEKLSECTPVNGAPHYSFEPFPSFPFEEVDESFQMIEDGSIPVIIPDDSVARELEALDRGFATRADMRKLSRHCVNVYCDALKRLYACGAVKPVEGAENLYLLIDASRYNEATGLDVSGGGKEGMLWL